MTKVKICCISSIAEAEMAVSYGADALGLVGEMPSGPGVIDDELIKNITNVIPSSIDTFLLTSKTKAVDVIAHYKKVQTTTIQLVDALEDRAYEVIRAELPHVKLVQVIHVMNEDSVKEAVEISKFVDAVLLDSGNPNLAVKELGGTGKTHNWEWSKQIKENIDIPLFLAGGLNKDNIIRAIEYVEPFGVDLCSGVRSNGKLDETKLKAFFDEIYNIG